jgi:hypothetical protein
MGNCNTLNLGARKKVLLSTAGLFVVAGPLFIGGFSRFQIRAQGLPTTGLSFEVASVKRDQAGACCGFPQFLPGGSFRASADPLEIMMDVAYGLPLKSNRISGGPDWVRSETELYTIAAKPPAGAIPAGLPLKDRDEKIRLIIDEERTKTGLKVKAILDTVSGHQKTQFFGHRPRASCWAGAA